jgi:hypothetical protein
MDAVLERDHLAELTEPEPQDDDVVGLAQALARFPTERAATRFTMAVERLTPGDGSSGMLWEVSELVAPVAKTDVDGRTALEVVVTKWLSFGYPWALEVPPEALAHVHRRDAEARSGVWAASTFVASVLSGGWYLLLVATVTLAGSQVDEGVDWPRVMVISGSLGCLGWLFEIVRTMATAKLDDRDAIEQSAHRLGRLGHAMWVAPVAMLASAPFSEPAMLVLGLLLGPLSVSGVAARLAARRLERR